MHRGADRNGAAREGLPTLGADTAENGSRTLDTNAARDGFRTLRAGRIFLRVAPDYEKPARSLGLLERGGLEALLARGGGPMGRAPSVVLALPGRDERLLLRAVRHGGWLAPLWGDRILGTARPSRELDVTRSLRERDAPVPEPVLAVAHRLAGPLQRAAVATVFEEDSADALRFLSAAPSAERVASACRAAGRAVRRLRDAGGRHRDLHLGNLLLREDDSGADCTVVDLDRARVVASVSPSARMTEIGRLLRSALKRRLWPRIGDAGARAFLDAYTGEESGLRDALLAHWPRERGRLALRGLRR
jgi:tRNA A-37 threonylcarbamoyl transferase component Bud32